MAGEKGPYRLLTPTEREWVVARMRAGDRAEEVALACGASRRTVFRLSSEAVLSRRGRGCGGRVSFEERERISRGLVAGESMRAIARAIGRDVSTVSREIAANGGVGRYRAVAAHRRAQRCLARPKATKLAQSERLRAEVERRLAQKWSPVQISARLKVDFPTDEEMRISHETIYLSLYVQSRGELRRQLAGELRTRRTSRKPRGRGERRGRIVDMLSISERPAEVEDRAVPGHWEGDLILGARNRSAVLTLVERQTRYVLLGWLGDDHRTEHVIGALTGLIGRLPAALARTVTWDQGVEMAAHKQFTVATDVAVYFCDPHAPWQRGTNENTNGLLRQYLPKGTDLAVYDQAALDHIADELNGRPRQTLGWLKPQEKMTELLGLGPAQAA